MRPVLHVALSIVISFGFLPEAAGWMPQHIPRCHTHTLQLQEFSFAEDFKSQSPEKKREDPIAAFKVGTIVRIVKPNLKAYQVPPAGYGSYDDDKNFVPLEDGTTERARKNLRVPVGLRGVVMKAYNSDDLSANFPIQVKFEPGKHVEEGYDPPVPFLFHLSPKELEIVE